MIKHIFFIFLFFSTFFAEAQYNSQFNRRQNMRSRQPMATQKPRAPKINVEKAVGLIFYNIEKVSKKIGIKETSDTYLKVFSILNSYNKELKQIKRINTFLFSEGRAKMEAAQKEAIKSRDATAFRLANKEVAESFKTIIGIIEKKDKELNLSLEKILSSKQLKKWKKYTASKKKK